MSEMVRDGAGFSAYVPGLARRWEAVAGGAPAATIDGALAFFDLSGFTRLSERLARRGRVGAEVMKQIVSDLFASLIDAVFSAGGDVLTFGGDALLVLFDGDGHAERAAQAAAAMQRVVRDQGRVDAGGTRVRLRMSAGLHRGTIPVVLSGTRQGQLMLAGAAVTTTTRLEAAAEAGQVLLSPELAIAIPASWLAGERAGGPLLRVGAVPPPTGPQPQVGARPISRAMLPAPELRPLLGTGTAEHRPVAMAFIQLDGTDAVVGDADAGGLIALERLLGRVTGAVEVACERFGVCWLDTDIASDGARWIVVAGVPRVSEHDADRILGATRLVLDECADLPVHAGAHQGPVFVGDVGHPDRRSFNVMGDAMNLAARLMARARPGELLASDDLLRASRARYETVALAPFTAKGKRQPVHARLVVGVGMAGSEPDVAGIELPLVGRSAELAVLAHAVEALAAGTGSVVELVGEPGMGKSRLLAEAARLATEAGVPVLATRADPYGGSVAYQGSRSLLRAAAGIDLQADAATAGERLAQHPASSDPSVAPWLGLVALAAGADIVAGDADLDPDHLRAQLHEVVVDWLGKAVPGPLVVLAEDLHWLDDASAALIAALGAATTNRPWLVCASRRPEGRPLESGADREHVAILQPLTPKESATLAMSAAGDSALASDQLHAMTARAAGNPLFVRELARTVASAAPGPLPDTVERVIASRVDTLQPPDRALLRDTAVAGGSVALDLLAEALGRDDLGRPETWRPLAPFVSVLDGTVSFHHDLIRTVAYEGLAFRRRRELHGRLAAAIEAHGDSEELAGLLARHYQEADLPDPAWRWSVLAGDRARAAGALVEAADLYQGALDVARVAPAADPVAVAGVAEALGDAAERLGRVESAVRAYRHARGLRRDDPLATARLLRKHARVDERAGRYSQALRWLARCLQLLESLPRTDEVTAAILEARLDQGTVRCYQGRYAHSIRLGQGVLVEAEGLGDERMLAKAHFQLEMACTNCRHPDEPYHGQRALELYQRLGDDVGLGNLLLNLGYSAYNENDADAALDYYHRAAEVYERAGDVIGAAVTVNNQAEILTDQGRYGEARERLDEARRVFRAARYAMGVALTTSGLSRLEVRAGRPEEAWALLERARNEFSAIGARSFVLDTDVRRVECLVFWRRPEDALDLAAATWWELGRFGAIAVLPVTLARLEGSALLQLGRFAEAEAALIRAEGAARAERVPLEVALVLHARLALAATGGPVQGGAATAAVSERDELLRRLGVVHVPDVPMP